ncbi:UDP-N-acetylmuramoyl-L-alanine--D-glutamate ligase [Oceanibacterium hippocampi]|uniref:UDP-N-acetylmuramoylalanine--D-glutamate ligase n=1 Tax=Oceanibacterium hippocampi TaxID=745714 RepID=A0A1Y5SCH7_9PROT|nr:UDP-N-acetylmuramoyl-L-alanine--D-glutamate ligase [Oceanibacterium hippocampi]SLN37290.1 UDP-N-acetylmuramoylalanine--D-glutamate ligase [Oceanibacterium hippocampi]
MIVIDSYRNRDVAVFGLGKSGLSTAAALAAGGARPVLWDDDEGRCAAAAAAGYRLADPAGADWPTDGPLVLSPGVPLHGPTPHPVVDRARAAGQEIIGDVELFLRQDLPARRVGITGTNGKSTTTALLGHILAEAGYSVAVGGNLGDPVLSLDPLDGAGIHVLELSSYQLDLAPSWSGDVSVLLNISPDHLDRHGGMAGYLAAKRKIFARQSGNQVAVVGVDDRTTDGIRRDLERRASGPVVPIGVGRRLDGGVYVVDGMLFDGRGQSAEWMAELKDARALPGRHNWQNAAAAAAAALSLGLEHGAVADGILSYPGLAHRQEIVGRCEGIRFVNDSKATNVDAATRALASYGTIYWIAGGRAKGESLDPLSPYFDRIRGAWLIGEAAEDFAGFLGRRVRTEISGTLARAVEAAWRAARADGEPDAVVLLSPACASFDQFANFEARGEAFRAAVAALPEACETEAGR